MTPDRDPALAATSLDELYPVLRSQFFTAGWNRSKPSLWPQPVTDYRPLHWQYARAKAALDQAGRWISTELAERRNLLMFNPVGDNVYATTRSIVAAYQMVRPGEYARAHRHTPNALRLLLDAGEGVYSVVDGQRVPMQSGDVVLTPTWGWHSHYNEGPRDAYWIDLLDVPLVHRLEPMFFEPYPGGVQPLEPPDPQAQRLLCSQGDTERALAATAEVDGVRLHVLPSDDLIPTLQLRFARLAAGATFPIPRSTATRVIAFCGGSGQAQVGTERYEWAFGDVIAVPAWVPVRITARQPALLFDCNDEPVLRKLGFHREEAAA